LSVEWIVINVGRIGRCKGRPQFPAGMMLCVMFNSVAPAGAGALMATRRWCAAQEEKRNPTRTTPRSPNVRSFTVTHSCRCKRKAKSTRSNEMEISHGRVPWQAIRMHFPLVRKFICNAYAATEAGRAMANASPNARSQSSRASAYRIDRDPVTAIRQGGWGNALVSNMVFHWSAACEHQSNDHHQYCFHLCGPLIVAASFTIRQSKTILA